MRTGTREEWLQARQDLLEAYKQRLGWTFTWASSSKSDFNVDFSSTVTQVNAEGASETVERFAAGCGTDVAGYISERPGVSAFALQDGVVHHTYYSTARGLDALWGMYPWLDRTPKGRNESGGAWWRRRDEYDSVVGAS